eukprot:gene6370-4595_t
MLSKKREAKKAAIAAQARKHSKRTTAPKEERVARVRPQDVATAEGTHAHAAGASLLKEIGDNINTRLQELSTQDLDQDVDVFDEKKRALMEEARLAAGTRQREVAGPLRTFLEEQQQRRSKHTDAEGVEELQAVRVGHNANAVTAVAALGLEVVVVGDKSGKVYLVDLSVSTSSRDTAAAAVRHTQKKQKAGGATSRAPLASPDDTESQQPTQRKVLLMPVMASGVVSLAVSDTRDVFASSRQLFEKSTVDTSCTSYIAAGCRDGSISIWETASKQHKGLLWLHRKPVTSLVFRPATSTLLSVSEDQTLRVWSVPQMMAMDQLFGHEGAVNGCDGLRRNACATVGADGTMRYWKLDAATQQAYTYVKPAVAAAAALDPKAPPPPPAKTSLEAVAMLSESIVLAGSADGDVIGFDINKRRPLFVRPAVHGAGFVGDGTGLEKVSVVLQQLAEANTDEEQEGGRPAPPATGSSRLVPSHPNPITAVAAVPYGNVCATASYDGTVRVWEIVGVGSEYTAPGRRMADETAAQQKGKDNHKKSTSTAAAGPDLRPIAQFPVPGLVSSMRFSVMGDALFIAVAKEPRGGRWVVQQSALNSVLVLPLSPDGLAQLLGATGPRAIAHIPTQLFNLPAQNPEEEEEEDDDDEEADLEDEQELEDEEEEEEEQEALRRATLSHSRTSKLKKHLAKEKEDDLQHSTSPLPKKKTKTKKVHTKTLTRVRSEEPSQPSGSTKSRKGLLRMDADGAMVMDKNFLAAVAAPVSAGNKKKKSKKSGVPKLGKKETVGKGGGRAYFRLVVAYFLCHFLVVVVGVVVVVVPLNGFSLNRVYLCDITHIGRAVCTVLSSSYCILHTSFSHPSPSLSCIKNRKSERKRSRSSSCTAKGFTKTKKKKGKIGSGTTLLRGQ